MKKKFYLYILASKRNGTLYTGITSNIQKRMEEHKKHFFKGSFSARYNVTKLVYLDVFDSFDYAVLAEKRIKKWYREQKLDLIEQHNPSWGDISEKPGFEIV
ncbi:MAG TPA: GIY-YIG nuclease family protein [Candidatus Cloacimonadota bacterium]|nr:GIY-YIG nuclease family protein [Candidatus Cloacimonadota bacterium]